MEKSKLKRTNDQWLADLGDDGKRDTALADLRAILTKGLPYALRKYLSPTNPRFDALVEQTVQDALLRILDKLDTFRGNSRFTTWAHKITINLALTELRRKRWEDTSLDNLLESDEGDILTPSFIADEAPSPEQVAAQADMIKQIRRIIAEELTDKQRQALVATQIKGMPAREVAKRMETTPNALYKLLHDARLKLKRRLTLEGMTPEDILATFE